MPNKKGKPRTTNKQDNRESNSSSKPQSALGAIRSGFWTGIGKGAANEFMKRLKQLFSWFTDDDPPSGSAGAFAFDIEA